MLSTPREDPCTSNNPNVVIVCREVGWCLRTQVCAHETTANRLPKTEFVVLLPRLEWLKPSKRPALTRSPQDSAVQQATLDDHSEVVPPLPIPNRTVKHLSADDSGCTSVKVGHRQALIPQTPKCHKHLGVCLWTTGFIVSTALLWQSSCRAGRVLRVSRARGNH